MRRRLAALHEAAAERSALTFVVSGKLAELEREAGREAQLLGLAADSFPAPEPGTAIIAVSLGHLGWRTDWALVRAVAERLPELVLLLVGAWHEDECKDDPDFHWCRRAPNLVWLGRRSDEEAARLILCADVGILPFRVEPFNDAALPYRILKYARLGRRTISPELAGVHTWDRAVTTAADADAFAAALRAQAGARVRPDAELRAWALEQTAERVNAPLWERLRELGVA
jgi:glycosyltransferase involved in cell wall biosynthesis